MIVASLVDPVVTQPTERQLMYLPSIGTFGDFGDDRFGITKHKNDIWKEDRHGLKSDLVTVLIYTGWVPATPEHAKQLVKNTFLTILHEL